MNPLKKLQDWNLVKKQKVALLEILQKTPVGAGVSIDAEQLKNPVMARAVIELLRDNPNDFEAMDYGFSLTIMRKLGMQRAMSHDSYTKLKTDHQILDANSLRTLGLLSGHKLPAHEYRDGVPDDVNGSAEQQTLIITDVK